MKKEHERIEESLKNWGNPVFFEMDRELEISRNLEIEINKEDSLF